MVYWSSLLPWSSLLLQQCSSCLVYLTRIVFVMGCRWPWSCFLFGFCLQDLFNTTGSILVQLLSSLYSILLDSVDMGHPYTCVDTTTAWKNCVLFYRSGLTSILRITYRQLPMPLLDTCWYHFRLMRRSFKGRLPCPRVSEDHHLALRCHLSD